MAPRKRNDSGPVSGDLPPRLDPAPRRSTSSWIPWCILAVVALGLVALWKKGAPRHEEAPEAAVDAEVSVHSERITRETLRHFVTAFGTVEPEPASLGKVAAAARITAPMAGLVAEVLCYEGRSVAKGDPLFRLDARAVDASIEQAQVVLAAAQLHLELLEKATPAAGGLSGAGAKARQERDLARSELDRALAGRERLTITAPLAGTVVYLNIRAGEVVDPESPTVLVDVVDLQRLIVAANVASAQLSEVKAGQVVEILPSTASGHNVTDPFNLGGEVAESVSFAGTVALVEDRVDPKTDMGVVDVSVPTGTPLRPGQFVRIRIVTEERKDCLTVPSRSVVKNEAGEWVISLISGKRAIQNPVQVGFQEGDRVQIQSLLLKAGDSVVTTGAYGLREKSRIRILNE